MRLKRKFGLVLYLIPIVFLIVLLILEIGVARKEVTSEGIAYREKSDITYKVKLKENNLYNKEYLDKDYNIIASLIDKFVVNYDYVNTFSTEMDYKVKYNVTADLVIYDSNQDNKPVYTNKYTLISDQVVTGKGEMAKIDLMNENINYAEYNAIVDQFKTKVVPDANLIVKFNTEFEGVSDKLADTVKSSKTSTLTIPVSQKTINIEVKKTNNNKEETVSGKKKLRTITVIMLVATIVLIIILIIKYILYVLKTNKKRSKYDQALSKILREFDRAITEARGKLRIDKDANTIEVKDFMELLDVHDNFNIPIIYYRISKYSSVFLVKNNNDIYFNIMKSDDYE